MSSGKWRPSCLGLNVLNEIIKAEDIKTDEIYQLIYWESKLTWNDEWYMLITHNTIYQRKS